MWVLLLPCFHSIACVKAGFFIGADMALKTNGSKINSAWAAVILTALVLSVGIVGTWVVFGERQSVQAKEIETLKKDAKIQTKVMIEIQTDVKWIKNAMKSEDNT